VHARPGCQSNDEVHPQHYCAVIGSTPSPEHGCTELPISPLWDNVTGIAVLRQCPAPGRGHLLGTHGPEMGAMDAGLGCILGRQWRP
jgi:hypothetical protein